MHSAPFEPARLVLDRLHFKAELLAGLIRRDITGRYRNSLLGLGWSLLVPLLMLVVYTVAFHDMLGARWPGAEGMAGFAAMVFVGLMVHAVLAETLGRAPSSIHGQPNFVTKLVFPLAVLPLVPVGVALIQALLGLMVLVVVSLLGFAPEVRVTTLLVPIVLAPFALMMAGVAWGLAGLGVYLRDIGQVGGLVSTALMFLSPVFFPLDRMPESYAVAVQINPVTFAVESIRALIFAGEVPTLANWLVYSAASLVVATGGLALFRRMRPGFGDVL